MNQHLKIGGVPEHFNLPWQLALERNIFDYTRINVDWSFYAGGTGAMTNALARGDLDLAILLTEGFISAVHQGLEAKVVKVYIDSPLVWGIHTGVQSGVDNAAQAADARYAISRFGSGSHLMAMIHAEQFGRQLKGNDFEVINSLHGAIDSLEKNETQLFYWERFMTRPFVKEGRVRHIGNFSAPWSGFLIVASENAINKKRDEIRQVLHIMNEECVHFKTNTLSIAQLTRRFDMDIMEARNWLNETIWNNGWEAPLEQMVNARNALTKIGACEKSLRVEQLCADWIQLV